MENIALNKLQSRVRAFNKDGRAFVRDTVEAITADLSSGSKVWPPFDHVVMNLPASALEFLDVFR